MKVWLSGLTVTEADSHRLFHRQGPGSIPDDSYEVVNSECGTGKSFSPSTSVFACRYCSTNASHSSSSTLYCYQTDKKVKPGNLPKSNALSEFGQQ
jgi:hypothetical protein